MLTENLGSSAEPVESSQKPAPVARNLAKQFAVAAATGETPIRSPYTKKPRVTSPVVEELAYYTITHMGTCLINAMIHDILGRTHCLTTVPRPALLPGLTCWRMKMIWTCVGRCLHSRSAPRWQLETMLSQRLLLQHPELKGHKPQKSQDYRIASSRRIPRSRTIASP